MQIVWDKNAIEKLKDTHTLLELETFQVEGTEITAYCVVPAEKLLPELPKLSEHVDLHNDFIKAFKDSNHDLCKELGHQLIGKFGGELDSFYTEILSRLPQS